MRPELVVRDNSDGTRMSGPTPTAATGEDGLRANYEHYRVNAIRITWCGTRELSDLPRHKSRASRLGLEKPLWVIRDGSKVAGIMANGRVLNKHDLTEMAGEEGLRAMMNTIVSLRFASNG
jgi:hypothetical protein